MLRENHPEYVLATARLLDLTIPPECMTGVLANLALLLSHATIVAKGDDALLDPAEVLQP
ncbi:MULTISPECIES: DUF4089 domain-containing protein [Sphingomonadales]|uniref:Uncharacterized protein n=1 Tax=Edaphosphingomonas haloaromaticamans TaxID=653954 RepID=A0A1S1HDW1_9SPHN|nr:DUF4089 domain-containing protein [Sphingomonas haloaromaticamans]OHT18680.1 hypothetical protein BHE75_00654 [Sphingomonas haloaromaticamans]